jgi:apolipoprotein N-acyltransferase
VTERDQPAADDQYSNPLARSAPLGGRTGVAVASLVPFLSLVLFLLFGFFGKGWSWSWAFFLLIPVALLVIYGPGSRRRDLR